MLPGDTPPLPMAIPVAALPSDAMERPRKPRPTGGPEGPWWRRPFRPD